MISANKEKLLSFFDDRSKQFKIPFFQRAYVWKEENWNELWDDVIEEINEQRSGNNNSEHFIGTIIVKQTDTGKLNPIVYDLIDGQQRLTTICLLLKALHDASNDEHLKSWINNLLVFSDSFGNKHIRITHSKVDAQYFQQIILSESGNESIPDTHNKVVKSYSFFKDKIKEHPILPNDIRQVVDIILEKLSVIHMALSVSDDVQQIFDTINSLGVKLTTGELLKNYLFSYPELTNFYEAYWKDIFEIDEETVEFWDRNKTSGRIIRTTIELFLYSYLVIINESNVKLESLFKEFKQYLKDRQPEELIHFAKEIGEYAKLYEKFPDGEELSNISYTDHEARFFYIINEFEINTASPLVLYIYKQVEDKLERCKIVACLESYLVRRTICKLTTKNYNKLFISIMVDLKKQKPITAEVFLEKLMSFTDDTNRFPDDAEFKIGFANSQLSNKYSKVILYLIALRQLNHKYQDNKSLSNESLSVEHIMPKKWRNYWKLIEVTKKDEDNRDAKLLTLGNLTLIKGRLNSSLRDASWDKKQKGLEPYSTLAMTRKYLYKSNWDEAAISERTDDLFNEAIAIWKMAVPSDLVIEENLLEKRGLDNTPRPKVNHREVSYSGDVTNSTPYKLTIDSKNYQVRYWKDVLEHTLNVADEIDTVKCSKYINGNPSLLKNKNNIFRSPRVLNSGTTIETNHTAKAIYDICTEVMGLFGWTQNDWIVEYR